MKIALIGATGFVGNYMTKLILKIFVLFIFQIFLINTGFSQIKYEKATFAGGCFWCMVSPFDKLDGVTKVISGYTGGKGDNPNYNDYAEKGHLEAVEITYDPSKITYSKLLDVFWRQVDPTDSEGQFCDRGTEYKPAIFYHNEEQKQLAEKSKEILNKSGRYDKPLTIEIIKATAFYKAEEYHQDYYKKNPLRYAYYRFSCGRDLYLDRIWKVEKK